MPPTDDKFSIDLNEYLSLTSQRSNTSTMVVVLVLALLSTLQSEEPLLGQNYNHTVYLRTSPVFCLAGLISFYVHVAQYSWYKIRGPKITFYDCIAHLAPAESHSHILWNLDPREASWLRLAWGVLCTIISMPIFAMSFFTYTLAEVGAVSWREFWGGCFALSALHCGMPSSRETAERRESLLIDQARLSLNPANPTQRLYRPLDLRLVSLDRYLFRIACAAHILLLFYLIKALWPAYEQHSHEGHILPLRGVNSFTYVHSIWTITWRDVILTLCALLPIGLGLRMYREFHTYSRFKMYTQIPYSAVMTIALWGTVYFYRNTGVISDVSWVSLFVGEPVALWYAIVRLGDVYPDLARKLLLRAPAGKVFKETMDREACMYLVGSAYTFVLGFLYCVLKYK